jgi:hypothetical protein
LLPKLRIDQNHPNPRKATLVMKGRRGSHDFSVVLHHKASARAIPKKSLPIGRSLVPSGKSIQTQAAGDVLLSHRTKMHRNEFLEVLNCVEEYLKP